MAVKLTTNHGDIVHRTGRRKGPRDRQELPRLRGSRPLRQHHLPPRDQRLHDPGWRHGARHEAEDTCGAPIKNEASNGLKNEAGTIAMARTQRPAFRHRPVLHQRGRQRLPQLHRPRTSRAGAIACLAASAKAWMLSNKIKGVKTGTSGFHQDVPKEDVVIQRAEVI
jgi:peptidyl-prolyl cis-trans isomerase B (cyclophilin B)